MLASFSMSAKAMLWHATKAESGGLLRILLLWIGQMSADPATEILLRRIRKSHSYFVDVRKTLVFRTLVDSLRILAQSYRPKLYKSVSFL
jgi:hypothetical protein